MHRFYIERRSLFWVSCLEAEVRCDGEFYMLTWLGHGAMIYSNTSLDGAVKVFFKNVISI